MKAVVFKGVGDIRLEEVKDPVLQDSKDVIVRVTTSAICGTDLHFVRGSVAGVKSGTILGHEGVGVVEQVGKDVKNFKVGDRVIVSATVCCGECEYCLKGFTSQCDKANPHGPDAGPVLFGGPIPMGSLDGLQAEKVRVPFADATLVKIPKGVTDEQVILLADILPTAYMGVDIANIQPDDTVAVFGCGPVGQLVIACLKKLKLKTIFAIDCVQSRLDMAQEQGAHVINFNHTDPVKELRNLTNQKGPTKVIDAVGIDAEQPQCCGIEFFKGLLKKAQFTAETKLVAPKTNPCDGNWYPGNAPSQVLNWAVQSVAKAGLISIVGFYPPLMVSFPIGTCMTKNLTVKIVNCDHRRYIPFLLDWIAEGSFDPLPFISHTLSFDEAIDAYKHFDKKEDCWIKVVLEVDK